MQKADRCIIFLFDGLGSDYLRLDNTPNIRQYVKEGAFCPNGQSVLPTLTNVNHVSMLSGTYPERHGISGNYYYDRNYKKEVFMNDPAYIKEKLILLQAKEAGKKVALITAKEKLSHFLGEGTDLLVDVGHYPQHFEKEVGPPPNIYSTQINLWVLRMAEKIIEEEGPDFIYVATTDYIEHKYEPTHPKMEKQLKDMDELFGRMMEKFDLTNTLLTVTADHGMLEKKVAISPQRILSKEGIKSRTIPLVKDGLDVHHKNLGGSVYVYLKDESEVNSASRCLEQTEGVEEVLLNSEAARYRLPPSRIGDIILFAKREYAFGNWQKGDPRKEIHLRTHGSKNARDIPIILAGAGIKNGVELKTARNIDIVPTIAHQMGFETKGFQGNILKEVLEA